MENWFPVLRLLLYYIIQERFAADAYTNLTVRHYEAAAFDPIPSHVGLFVFLFVGGHPGVVQHFTSEQLQQSVDRYRRVVAAEHAGSR
jgi:hypothetical protein